MGGSRGEKACKESIKKSYSILRKDNDLYARNFHERIGMEYGTCAVREDEVGMRTNVRVIANMLNKKLSYMMGGKMKAMSGMQRA